MRRLVCLCLAVGVGVGLGRWFDGVPATAAAGVGAGGGVIAPCAAKNGDVNADGKVDLSDAVTILGHLFLGNPTELVGLCAGPPAASGLPDTGQSKCYDASGAEISCESATCSGQDGSYATGCPREGRFTDNGDGTVTDHCTGLMWQKDTADVNGDGRVSPEWDGGDLVQWCNALTYCEGLSFAGHDDWKLPDVRELQSIVDYGRFGPAMDPVFGAFPDWYWSSTSNAVFPFEAWLVHFFVGRVVSSGDVEGDDAFYVRAVRSGP